jgi:hypothetical protein
VHPSLILVAFGEEADRVIAGALGDAGQPGYERFVPTGAPPGDYGDPPDIGISGIWILHPPPFDALDAVLATHGERIEAYEADTRDQWRYGDDEPGGLVGRPLRLAFVNRRPDITEQQFDERWDVHAGVAREHQPDFRRYRQHLIRRAITPAAGGYAGVAELEHRHVTAATPIRRAASPESEAIVNDDIRGFLAPGGARSVWVARVATGAGAGQPSR